MDSFYIKYTFALFLFSVSPPLEKAPDNCVKESQKERRRKTKNKRIQNISKKKILLSYFTLEAMTEEIPWINCAYFQRENFGNFEI